MRKRKPKAENAASASVAHTLKVTVPKNWGVVPLETVLEEIIGGGTPARDNPSYWNGSIPWLTVKDMRTRRPEDSIDHISEQAVRDSATNIIPADTVIIATRIGLGKVIRVPYDAAINQDLKALITKPAVDKSYLEYWIYSISNYLESIGSGTTVKGIRLEHVRSLPFPLAPLVQQKRIVAEIEKQFSRLDEAVTNLKRVKSNLKRYKAAVLKAAVEGRLVETEASIARREGRNYETGEQLLQRILDIRRQQWLARAEQAGGKGKGKYKEPAAPDTTDLPELPEGWVLGTFGHLCHIQGGFAFKSADYVPQGVPLVRISNLVNGSVQLEDDTVFLPEGFLFEYADYRLKKGDTLMAMSGATTGKMATFTLNRPTLLNQRVGRFQATLSALINSGYISLLTMRASGKVLIEAYGAAQPNISPTEIEAMPVGIPPLAEQKRIVEEVERRLSLMSEIEAQVVVNLMRIERLRQSILSSAFNGRLFLEKDNTLGNSYMEVKINDI